MRVKLNKAIFIVLAIALLISAAAAWGYLMGREPANRLVLSGTVEADEIHVGSKVGGRVASVLVKEGQAIKQGEAIIRFEGRDLEPMRQDAVATVAQAEANLQKMQSLSRPEEVAEARAEAEAARISLELARNGPRPQETEAARAELRATQADYEVARLNLDRLEELARSGVASRQDYDNAKGNFDRARARSEAAGQRLDLLMSGTRREEIERAERQFRQAEARRKLVEEGARAEDIAAARAQLERARAALQSVETQIAELEVTAPADAFVEVLEVRPGDLINANAPVATLVEAGRLWVRVFVPEPELGHVQLGKEVAASVDTFPDETFRGWVEQVASRGEFTPRNVQTREERTHQVFGVRVRLDNSTQKLRAGMAADVVIPKAEN